MRLHGRLGNEISTLGSNLIDISSRAIDVLSKEDLEKIKELALDYDKFGHWEGYIGDQENFEKTGNALLEKTDSLLKKINSKITKE
jgi:hypothetical protein